MSERPLPRVPTLSLTTCSDVVSGAPIPALLHWSNPLDGAAWNELPDADLARDGIDFHLQLTPLTEGPARVHHASGSSHGRPRVALEAGQSHTMLVDLRTAFTHVEHGAYRLAATAFAGPFRVESEAVSLELKTLSQSDSRVWNEWFSNAQAKHWMDLVLGARRVEMDPSRVSDAGWKHVAWIAWMQRAVHADEGLAALDLEALDVLNDPLWEGIVRVWTWEVLTARGDHARATQMRDEVLARWPGCARWVTREQAMLSSLRRMFG